jgi:hypothetical protein
LARLVETRRFFDLPARTEHATAGGDRFGYAITVEDGSRSHTVKVGEAAVPPPLRPLIEWLTAAARRA